MLTPPAKTASWGLDAQSSGRLSKHNPSIKRAIASYFWRHYFSQIDDASIHNLFFESGSTIAYLSAEFRAQLREKDAPSRKQWTLRTNNILTYMQFILFEDVRMELYPHGIPENTYGATFGPIATLNRADSPSERDTRLHLLKRDKDVVLQVATELLPYDRPSLVLGTASGLELKPGFVFPGPHVGSYHNKLFKRAMFASPHPIVLFLDTSKISPVSPIGTFQFNHCHPVFDNAEMWKWVYSSVPLAFCIGSDTRETLNHVVELLETYGFSPDDAVRADCGNCVVMMENTAFREAWGQRVDLRRRAIA